MDRRIQVVVGEAEPDAGWLRFVLEGEGFDMVGVASNDDELDRVLRGARPSVIVVDAGISALAATRARRRAPEAALLVVWPDCALASIADACVRPSEVLERLGDAVRTVAPTASAADPRIDVAEELGRAIRAWRASEPLSAPVRLPRVDEPAVEEAPRLKGRSVLVLAATWILILTVLATLAVGVPRAIRGRVVDERPTPSVTVGRSPAP
jgi:CheY-like chemotaxis protein